MQLLLNILALFLMCEVDISHALADVLGQQLDHYEFVKIRRDIRKSV